MFTRVPLPASFVAMSLMLGLAGAACSPVLPPAAPSVAALTAVVPPPAGPTDDPPAVDPARAKLLYPYNLPQYDELAAAIAAASLQTKVKTDSL